MKKSLSVKVRILMMGLLFPLILFMLIVGFLGYSQYRGYLDQEWEELLLFTEKTSQSVEIIISRKYQLLQDLASLPITQDVLPRLPDSQDWEVLGETPGYDRLQQTLDALLLESIDLLYLASRSSRSFIANREPSLPDWYDARERGWYTGAMDSPGYFISPPYETADESGDLAITVALKILDGNGREMGVAALDYNIIEVVELLTEIGMEAGSNVTLYARQDGAIIWGTAIGLMDPEDPLVLEPLARSLGYEEEGLASLMENLLTNQDFYYFEGSNIQGGTAMFCAYPIPTTGWGLLVSRPKDTIIKEAVRSVALPVILLGILFLAIQFLVFGVISRSILNPLRAAKNQLEDLSTGEADLNRRLDLNRGDEIGQLGNSFDLFMERLHALVAEIKSAVEGAESIKDALVSAAEETSSSIEEISANIDSMQHQTQSLDQNIENSVSSIEEINANMHSVDDQINDQAAMVEESTAAITEMISSLENVSKIVDSKRQATENLAKVARDGKSQLDRANSTFSQVVNQITTIQEMTNTINSIASQTNLLSMNAAIEAAHAGEAGRGFAVVAEEIRKLADSSRDSSASIAQTIQEVTQNVQATNEKNQLLIRAFDKVVTEVSDTVNAFSEIEHSVSELTTGGQQVLQASLEINNVTSRIRSGSTEIKQGTNQVLDAASMLKQISGNITGGSMEISTGSKEIVTAMQQLVELSSKLNDIVALLSQDFEKFTV